MRASSANTTKNGGLSFEARHCCALFLTHKRVHKHRDQLFFLWNIDDLNWLLLFFVLFHETEKKHQIIYETQYQCIASSCFADPRAQTLWAGAEAGVDRKTSVLTGRNRNLERKVSGGTHLLGVSRAEDENQVGCRKSGIDWHKNVWFICQKKKTNVYPNLTCEVSRTFNNHLLYFEYES